MFRRVIVPLDGSDFAERALAAAVEVAERLGLPLTLVRAYEGPERSAELLATMAAPTGLPSVMDPATIDAVTRAAQEEGVNARHYLEERAQALTARGLTVDAVVSDAPPADAILGVANDAPAGLIVMSTHGRGGVERLVFGSVAQEVLRRSPVPVLLLRGAAAMAWAAGGGRRGMQISLGDTVMGTDGKLGEVHRVIADAASERVTEIVVKHGFVFGSERKVPLRHVAGAADGAVQLDMDERTFATMDAWTADGIRAPYTDYVGPPPADLDGTYRGNAALDQAVAMGPLLAHGKVLGYPGGEQLAPDDLERPTVSRGMDIVDAGGEKVGEVQDLTFDAGDGRPLRVVLRRGILFHHDAELPMDWVQGLSDQAVTLNVPKSDVEALAGRD